MNGAPEETLAQLSSRAVEALGASDGAGFEARLRLVAPDLWEALTVIAPAESVDDLGTALLADALAAARDRPAPLRVLDRHREVDPTWFLSEQMIGYVCYADRFADRLGGVLDRLDYLAELGVSYLHLMPLLRPRDGENDGGYAVADYEQVDPRVGTMADLERLATGLRERGIALCVDLVLNHTAQEHAWARAAEAGDPTYRDYYRFFGDRTVPDAFERTLPEVFPDMAPGSFTHLESTDEWVWTTFHEFQWDLDWSNPAVLREMLGVIFRLANRGVDVLRLDAAPFLWKRLGTNCQNQPEAHRILQVLRALTHLAAPGVVLKAEAIVGPDELLGYLGAHAVQRPECHLAYDNQLMVLLWSTMATRDARLASHVLRRRPALPAGTGWVSYVRCHDDIGWAIGDDDARALGLDPFAHRRFLADFYAGRFPGSFAEGVDFQANPETGDIRTCGATAALTGLQRSLVNLERGGEGGVEVGDRAEQGGVEGALRRIELLYSVVYAHGGIPLIWSGDELAQGNDHLWDLDPRHSDDNRWIHRPRLDWEAAERRHDVSTPQGCIFTALQALADARRSTQSLRSDAVTTVLDLDFAAPSVLAFARRHPRAAPVVVVANFGDHPVDLDLEVLWRGGTTPAAPRLAGEARVEQDRLHLPAWGYGWFGGDVQ